MITNAIKYSDKGQTVLVRAMKKENHVFLSVIDTGLGIEKAEIKSIFDLFYIGKMEEIRLILVESVSI